MAYTYETACRSLRKKLTGTTKFVYALNQDYRRVDGRIKSNHYARRVVEGELRPELHDLRMRIDEEKAYCERDCLRLVDRYRDRTGDNDGADELQELVCEFVEQHMGNGYALGILPEYFGEAID